MMPDWAERDAIDEEHLPWDEMGSYPYDSDTSLEDEDG